MAHTISARTHSTGVVNNKELFFLYCLVEQEPCNLAYHMAAYFSSIAKARTTSSLTAGAFVTRLAQRLEVLTPEIITTLHEREKPEHIGIETMKSMGLARDTQWGVRMFDHRNRIWDPVPQEEDEGEQGGGDEEEAAAGQNPPFQQGEVHMDDIFANIGHQYQPPPFEQPGYPSMMDLYQLMEQTRNMSIVTNVTLGNEVSRRSRWEGETSQRLDHIGSQVDSIQRYLHGEHDQGMSPGWEAGPSGTMDED